MSITIRGCLVLAVLATGCMKTSATYCAKHGADDPENCPPVDAPVATTCTSNADCADSPATLVCNIGTQVCAECNLASSQTAACNGLQPVCGADDACRGCRAHTECLSGACLPDGSCGTDDNVAFVDGQLGTGGECTRAAPCSKLSDALAKMPYREFIKIKGSLDENITISGRDVTLLADPGARISKGSGRVLLVEGTSNVTVYDLQIGSATSSSQIGVELAPTATGTTALHRVRVVNTTQGAINALGGKLVLERSTIADNDGGGVIVRTGALEFTIRNNFILFNGRATGTSSTPFGGVLIEKDSGTSAVEFNTIAYNESNGLQNRAGLACFGSANAAGGNLVYGNREGIAAATDLTQVGGNCQTGNTFAAGAGDLGFANPSTSTFDPHLTATSPATVLDAGGACAARVPADIDGNARPSGAACDLGADELAP